MKIAIAADHAGFELKEEIKRFLYENGHEVEDFGAFELNPEDDYPDFIGKAAEYVSKNGGFGIVLGKSGAGEAIVANKYPRVRAILGVSEQNVRLSREHNDANILSLGSTLTSIDEAKTLINIFINTQFSNEPRHARRIKKIEEIEKNN